MAKHIIFFLNSFRHDHVFYTKKNPNQPTNPSYSENQNFVQYFNPLTHTLGKSHQAAKRKTRDSILSHLSFKCSLVITFTTDSSSNNVHIWSPNTLPDKKIPTVSSHPIVCLMPLIFCKRVIIELCNYFLVPQNFAPCLQN